MEYKIYKFHFKTAVHFGNGTLTDTSNRLMADTVFSAICLEAVKKSAEGLQQLVTWAKEGSLQISDAMPFIEDTLYLPKPTLRIQTEQSGDSTVKKAFKKLKYIPLDMLQEYLQGDFDPTLENTILKSLGKAEVRTLATSRNKEEAEPFFVGTYRFSEGNGLYLIAGFSEKEIEKTFTEYLTAVSYTGIGGKRSAGLGKFVLEIKPFAPENLIITGANQRAYMTLSLSMAKPEELTDLLEESTYTLIRRSGFISSDTYAPEQRRKKDFYAFQSGSCFSHPFQGDVFDVSGNGKHPVYRYAKPMFLEVKP